MPRDNEIQFRRGTGTEWSTIDPVLASGEPGINNDSCLLKIGNGSTAWSNLASTSSILAYLTVNTNYTISYSDHIIFIDTSSNIVNLTLPSASGYGGKYFIFKQKSGTLPVYIYASGAETIDDKNLIQIFYEKNSIGVVSDNSNWYII